MMLTFFAGLFWIGLIVVLIAVGVCCAAQSFCEWAREKFARPIGWWCRVVPEDVRSWMAVSLVVLGMVAVSVLIPFGAVWLFGGKH